VSSQVETISVKKTTENIAIQYTSAPFTVAEVILQASTTLVHRCIMHTSNFKKLLQVITMLNCSIN